MSAERMASVPQHLLQVVTPLSDFLGWKLKVLLLHHRAGPLADPLKDDLLHKMVHCCLDHFSLSSVPQYLSPELWTQNLHPKANLSSLGLPPPVKVLFQIPPAEMETFFAGMLMPQISPVTVALMMPDLFLAVLGVILFVEMLMMLLLLMTLLYAVVERLVHSVPVAAVVLHYLLLSVAVQVHL